MGKKLGVVALIVGAFALAIAVLAPTYVYSQVAVAPLNTVSTTVSETVGDAEYLDVAAGPAEATGPLRSTRVTTGDVKASEEASEDLGRDVTVWQTYSCVDTPEFDCGDKEATPLSGTLDVVAFDRVTGEAVNWKGTSTSSGGTTARGNFSGQYFKFPFDTQKKTYRFWDSTLKTAVPIDYVGTEKVDGLTAYKFEQTIDPTQTGTIAVPGSLVGDPRPTVVADRIYSNVRTLWIEPQTGVILVGQEKQDSWLAVGGERKLTTTQATLKYTDGTTQATVDEYRAKSSLLAALRSSIPIGGGIAGVLLVGLGAFGIARSRRADQVDPKHATAG